MKVAVIGAGTMGQGIAKAFAQCDDFEKVYLCDIKTEFAEGGLAKIKKGYEKLVSKGKMDQAAVDSYLAKFETGLNSIATDPDLVVEAALEVMQIKKDCFKDLMENVVKNENCIFASNTSSLSITEIGAGLPKPIVGMHFFNPADRMKLIEVIAGANTPADLVNTVKDISVKLGKTPVQVNEAAGFVVNRVLVPMTLEPFSASGLSHLIASVNTIRQTKNPKLQFSGLLYTMWENRIISNDLKMQAEFYKQFLYIYTTPIPRSTEVNKAFAEMMPLLKYNKNNLARLAYSRFCDEFLEREG